MITKSDNGIGPTMKEMSRVCSILLLMLILAIHLSTAFAEEPDAPRETKGLAKGTLLVGGGGTLSDAIYDRFVERAGGKSGRLVLIPTATEDDTWLNDPEKHAEYVDDWKKEGIESVAVLHTRDRVKADQAEFVHPLTTATAVWISGGDQALLEQAYVGTRVETEIQAVLARGGIVGGSSAGAAIQSRVMIRCGDEHPEIGTGFDLVPGAIVDQHFLRRNRVNRLCEAVGNFPERFGIGVDEGTAILVQDNHFEVLGASYVMLIRMPPDDQTLRIEILCAGEKSPL